MKHFKQFALALTLSAGITSAQAGNDFVLTSNDITHGESMPKAQEFIGFGCDGSNLSPHLKWANVPKGTKSFALTVYDPDAPTGSGWWHWQVINLPTTTTEISQGAKILPADSVQISNDYGVAAFGGACPPKGHGPHRYQFKIHALSVEKLELNSDVSGALAGYMIDANTIATATLEALYERK